MKRLCLITASVLVMSSLAAGWSQKTDKSKAQGNKAGLEQTANEFLEAVKATNLVKIRGYYAADYTFTGPDGKMVGAEERLKQMAGGSNVLNFSDVKVRTYGGTGVVTGMATNKTDSGGTEPTRFTQTWTWQGGRWQLAASQVTRISP